MYVTIEKMAHGLVRRYAPARDAEEAQVRLYEALEEWCKRGYTVLQSSCEEAVIIDGLNNNKPIAILQITTIEERW